MLRLRVRRYIADVAKGLVGALGIEVVTSFRWGVFTEFNNADWLASNADTYIELYDHTVCGLADALGG